ncbi:DUF2852 domain-containing protein [Chelatococcus sp. SYSU_G07232]|uniref:DUF2852 domain-containing protein n=1 Tax=Chelatococcus albus TaxID=3047466 RepID=A0ABT7AHE8_9HYPH|nr:DUF2852 domain-containing protein [Chelatococcus sp. SYSU_G07232]MDJ1158244.1 DUF2852 domain-containing protein [Chelatococcus sp. SYSU_G07232]
MPIAEKLDEYGKGAWIALTILGFIAFWPLGLAVLAYAIGSGRMACGGYERYEQKMARMQSRMDRLRSRMEGRGGRWGGGPWGGRWGNCSWGGTPSSGNRAFDEYRAETLRRLEEEQREFQEFLERLRFAKDKTEFDQFMAERRNRSQGPEAPPSA